MAKITKPDICLECDYIRVRTTDNTYLCINPKSPHCDKRVRIANEACEQGVLDPFMGSASTAIACIRSNRHFIGFELNGEYYEKAMNRIKLERQQLTLF